MSKEIVFTNILGLDLHPPKPGVKAIPDWYLNTSEYTPGNKKIITDHRYTTHTIKKCMPVLDSITAGYILYTQVDIQVTHDPDGNIRYTWPSQDALSFHPIQQASLHPLSNGQDYPKWVNPYSIETPPGYSVLIVPPLHRESVFTIFPGVVDTDKYKSPIHFPFVLNNEKWSGIIDAGTPLAQVIPFKRDSWKHSFGSDKEKEEQMLVLGKLKSMFFNSYKKQFWTRKEYK